MGRSRIGGIPPEKMVWVTWSGAVWSRDSFRYRDTFSMLEIHE